jgi:hypothetical protein
MERSHHIDPEEVAVKGIVVSPVHLLDVEPLSHQKARELIIAIGHFMGYIPPKAVRIEDIGSGQDQASSFVQELIDFLQELNPLFEGEMLNDFKEKNGIERFLNLFQAVVVVRVLPVHIHAFADQVRITAIQAVQEVPVGRAHIQDLLTIPEGPQDQGETFSKDLQIPDLTVLPMNPVPVVKELTPGDFFTHPLSSTVSN